MAPFLPASLYSGACAAALAKQEAAERSLQAAAGTPRPFLMGNMVPAPAEKKIQMYSKVRGLTQGGMKAWRLLGALLTRSLALACTCGRLCLQSYPMNGKGLPSGEVMTHWRRRWRPTRQPVCEGIP